MKVRPEAEDFLRAAEPARNAFVATVDEDGAPRVVPVWYRWDGSHLFVWTNEDRAWVRNLRRDPRVAVTVAEDDDPHTAVMVTGEAHFEPASREEIRRIVTRYARPHRVDAVIEAWGEGILMRVQPRRVLYRSG